MGAFLEPARILDRVRGVVFEKASTFLSREMRDEIKASPLWPLVRPRRIHVYGVGAAKTGTTSVATLFADRYRARHEARAAETIHLVKEVEGDALTEEEIRRKLRRRDRVLRLEVEVSQLLVHFLPFLVDMYPEAKFLFTVREPRSWLRSVIDQNVKTGIPAGLLEEARPVWRQYGVLKYGEAPDGPHPPQERVPEEQGLYSLDAFLSNWAWHNRQVVRYVPKERRLTLRTKDLSSSLEEIATFVGGDKEDLKEKKSHVHKSENRSHLLQEIDESYIRDRIDVHCSDTIDLIEKETGVTFD